MERNRWKQRIIIYSLLFCLIFMTVLFVMVPKETVSKAERRRLAEKPKWTVGNVLDKSFMDDVETYLLDYFPFREDLRRVKAYFAYDVLQQKENNDIYVEKGHAAKLEYPLNEASVKRLANKMTALKQQYFPNQTVWYAIVPDKNYFLAEKNGYPAIDYEQMIQLLSQELGKDTAFQYIDIISGLTIDDYYRTDTHWRQERLLETAYQIAHAMGQGSLQNILVEAQTDFEEHMIENFYGVYYGQAALPMEPDTIVYLTDEVIDAACVWNLEDNIQLLPDGAKAVIKPVYQTEKLADEMSLDKYDLFLGGASSLQIIESPKALTDKKLVIFRDSYTSSLAPLLLKVYKEITLIDLRYIRSAQIGEYVDFSDADILFLYNTSIVNHAEMLK